MENCTTHETHDSRSEEHKNGPSRNLIRILGIPRKFNVLISVRVNLFFNFLYFGFENLEKSGVEPLIEVIEHCWKDYLFEFVFGLLHLIYIFFELYDHFLFELSHFIGDYALKVFNLGFNLIG